MRNGFSRPLRIFLRKRNESPVLQLSHETAGAELVQRRNGVHVWVLTVRKNKTLTPALLYHANGKSYKKMDRAMHKAVVQAARRMRNYRPGCLEGRIGVYGASSSPMGRLARAIQKY